MIAFLDINFDLFVYGFLDDVFHCRFLPFVSPRFPKENRGNKFMRKVTPGELDFSNEGTLERVAGVFPFRS